MKHSFDEIVERLTEIAQPFIVDGKLDPPSLWPEQQTIAFQLGIYRTDLPELMPVGTFVCSEQAALALHDLIIFQGNAAAFELCLEIAADRVGDGEPVPVALRNITTAFLLGGISRPTPPRRNRTWLRNSFLLLLARIASEMGGLAMTRSDEAKNAHSACDAVAAALARLGYHTTFRSIKEIAIGSNPTSKQIQAEFEQLKAAVTSALTHDVIAHVVQPIREGSPGAVLRKLET